ncbi:MAG TPA: energy transducer TonB [Flavobacterium sp.]|uniref:energy transducer TonB n=1 Tax=Flavobacterium sp. TaxID=239 RepID=UPI002B4B5CBB|nr:energy transducer TonB [Flavobacterium sp.]HLO73994.1 energy transducer TonB [Flavobacterium sp.]
MKKIFTFCFFIIYTCSFAQTEILKTIYEDSLGKTANEDNFYIKKEYSFYGKDYIFKISNFKKSTLEKDVFTDDTLNIYLKAKVVNYHKNGVIAEISYYEKNSIVDEVNTWYDNGQSKEIFKFLEDQKTKSQIKLISQFWDKNNNHLVINGNGEYKNIDPENNIYEVGKVQNYRKSGNWELKSKQYSVQENYEEGKLIFGKAVYTNGETYEYREIEIRPKPKKGFEHFYQFVGKKLKVDGDSYGKMMIQFVVDKDGELIDLKIKKGISPKLDASAIEILKEYGKWVPGKYRGKAVKVQYLLPITIKQS